MESQSIIVRSDDKEADYLVINDPNMIVRLMQSPINLNEAIRRLEALAMYVEDAAWDEDSIVEYNLRQIVMMLMMIEKQGGETNFPNG